MMKRLIHVGLVAAILSLATPAFVPLSTPAFAQQVIADTPIGLNGHEGNEDSQGSKIDDPAKYRLTTPITAHGGGGGMVSYNASRYWNRVVFGGDQLEMAGIRVEQAEDVRGQVGNLKAEFSFLCNDGSGQDDAAMQKCLSFTYTGITRISPYILRDLQTLLGGNVGSSFSRMVSPNGLYWFQPAQDDGNFVLYRVDFDENGGPAPVAIFDLWSLLARLERIDAELRALEGRR
jgi:hypothetical protein